MVEGCHTIEGGHPSVWLTAIQLPLQERMIGNDQSKPIRSQIELL